MDPITAIVLIILLVVVLAAALMLASMKVPQREIHAFEAPTTEVGAIIPVLFGTRPNKGPLLPWYGDVNIYKVKPDTGAKK